ncbi:unnamed protein product [Amaranthus hypochondriacus]
MEEEEPVLWKAESSSMLSSVVGRVMNTLLSARPKKLEDAIVKLGETPKSPLAATLEDSLHILIKYVRDSVDDKQPLDEVIIPMIENVLRCKESKRPNQALILLNWLFQDESLFVGLGKDLVNIVSKRGDHYIALGWCKLVRSLVKYETKMTSFSKRGLRDNYQALLKILSSSIMHLSEMVNNGSVLQEGFELPTRLAAAAADCILVLTEALTHKISGSGSSNGKGAYKPYVSIKRTSILDEKMVDQSNMPSAVSDSIDGKLLLRKNLDYLIILVQKLQSWSQKSRALHAKGLGQVLRWLQQIRSSFTHVEEGSQFQMSGVLLLSSCWRHYSMLSILEDIEFYQQYDKLAEQYLSGIKYYSEDNFKDQGENGDSCLETKKFFLNCLALLLGRLDDKRLESLISLSGQQICGALFSQLHSADEDVVDMAICIVRFVIFKLAGSSFTDSIDSKELVLTLLGLLDELDGASKAVTVLIADICSISADDWCLNEVLKRLASGSVSQRRNAVDVVSKLIQTSSNLTEVTFSSSWEEIANHLLNCLKDEDSLMREKAMSLLPLIDPSLVLPALVRLICSSDGNMKLASSNAFIQVLRMNNGSFEVISILLDSLSGLSNSSDHEDISGGIMEGTSKFDLDEVFKLIPEWSQTVEDWNLFVEPLVDKMLSEPTNVIFVRFLCCINEHLADTADLVLGRLLLQARKKEEIIGLEDASVQKTYKNDVSDNMKNVLFDRLCPLLLIKMLPLKVFDDFNCMNMYSPTLKRCIASGADHIAVCNYECVATLLFNRAFCQFEYEDVRKLAAELCGRIHPRILFPVALSQLQVAAESKEFLKMKACLFAICTSLAIRGWESVSHPDITKIIRILQAVLLWPSVEEDEVVKVQHGCIDCLALMICAELQAPKNVRHTSAYSSINPNAPVIQTSGGHKTRTLESTVLAFVIDNLANDEGETNLTSRVVKYTADKTLISIPFRLCMANVLISTCQKVSESCKKTFAKKILPRLVRLSQTIQEAEIRAACVQVLFSAASHLKWAILPYGHDLLKVSLNSLKKDLEQERMAGARLMASLMASDDAVIESISMELVEARSMLLHICTSDPSPQLRQVCQKLLVCLTSQ